METEYLEMWKHGKNAVNHCVTGRSGEFVSRRCLDW